MKICMFTNTYLPHVGGVARSVAFFAEDLRAAGHRVAIIAPTFPDCKMHDKSEPDIYRIPAIQNFNGSDFSVSIPAPFLVDEQVDTFNPDIIHSHHPYLLGDAALRAARRRNLPLIFTHHTLYEEYAHYITDNSDKMKRFAAILSTHYANLCDRVVVPSRSIEDLIRERGVTVPIREIPTGVDTHILSHGDGKSFRERHGIGPASFVIGHLGRLAPEKNLAYLATAAASALQQLPDARFLVVGEGPSEETILQIFDACGLAGRLIMAGKITGEGLADAYHAMNIFAFASKSETQGMVLIEAMAAGIPVIALDAPGAREVVQDQKNGRLLDSGASENQFGNVLAWTGNAPKNIAAWAQEARKTAVFFARDRSAKKMLRLYADAVSVRLEAGAYKTASLDFWDRFLLACRAEWDLVAGKSESVIQALDKKKEVVGFNE